MHEGINSRALNAYVEIVFDNSDSRIMVSFLFIRFDPYFVLKIEQIEKPEVAVRRQISGKKDNSFIDRKVVK